MSGSGSDSGTTGPTSVPLPLALPQPLSPVSGPVTVTPFKLLPSPSPQPVPSPCMPRFLIAGGTEAILKGLSDPEEGD